MGSEGGARRSEHGLLVAIVGGEAPPRLLLRYTFFCGGLCSCGGRAACRRLPSCQCTGVLRHLTGGVAALQQLFELYLFSVSVGVSAVHFGRRRRSCQMILCIDTVFASSIARDWRESASSCVAR